MNTTPIATIEITHIPATNEYQASLYTPTGEIADYANAPTPTTAAQALLDRGHLQ